MEKNIKKLKVVEDDFVSDALRQRFRNSLSDALVKKYPYKTSNFLKRLVVKFETGKNVLLIFVNHELLKIVSKNCLDFIRPMQVITFLLETRSFFK